MTDGLSTVFQGVEGHGEAQVFGPSQTVGQFDAYMREAAQSLGKRKEQAALDAAKLSQVDTDKIWDQDQTHFLNATKDLQKGTADFYKKASSNPNWATSEEGFREKLKLADRQAEINYQAIGSTEAKTGFVKLQDKYNSDSENYDNPQNLKLFGDILAEKDMTKRNERVRSAKLKKNVDYDGTLKKWSANVGTETITTDNGVKKITLENSPYDSKGNLTKFGENRDVTFTAMMMSKDGKRLVEDKADYFIGLDLPVPPANILEELVRKDFDATFTSKNVTDVAAPRAPTADEKKTQTPTYRSSRTQGVGSTSVHTSGADSGKPMTEFVTKDGETVTKEVKTDSKGKQTIIYKDKKGGEYNAADVSEVDVVETFDVTSRGTFDWTTPVAVAEAPEFAINMKNGKPVKVAGAVNYEMSSYDKFPYIETKNGPMLLRDVDVAKDKEGKATKWGWFAQGVEVGGMIGGREVRVARAIPLTPALYAKINNKNLTGVDVPQDELWGIKGTKPTAPDGQLLPNESAQPQPDGRVAIFDRKTKKFLRWQK